LVTIMLSPRVQAKYLEVFSSLNVQVKVVSENVQDLLDRQEKNMELTNFKGTTRNIENKFARYPEIRSFVYDTVQANPDIASVYVAGKSVESRELPVIVLKTATSQRAIWIDCGIHAREWVSPASCVYLINQIIREYRANEPQTVALLNKYEIHVLPLLNPDGYEFSHSNTRLWRKNRSRNGLGICYGVDLNRNCDYRWLQGGSSSVTCVDTYAGPSAGSEPETKAVTAALQAKIGLWDAYYSIHSYGNWWLLPYGHSTTETPENYAELKANGDKAVAAIKAKYGENFTAGQSSVLLYITTGSTSDCAYANFNIPISVVMELRPGADSPDASYGFELPEDRLLEVTDETWAGLKASIVDVATRRS
jgi:murein tripeptide amidase MpaA